MDNLQQLEYDDAIISLYSVCHQFGARQVFADFRLAFPEMFDEIVIQLLRPPPERVAALLR